MVAKIALVTGANKGIGFEAARQLGLIGFHVIVGARDLEKGRIAAEALRAQNISAEPLALAVDNPASVEAAAREVAGRHPRLDVLINNAGVNPEYGRGVFSVEQLSVELLREVFETNFFGAYAVLRAFLPLLRKAPAARVVNVASTLGSLTEQARPGSPYYAVNTLAYNASKTALNAITVQAAKQFAGTPIKINSACPGWVRTDMGTAAAPRSVEQGASILIRLATIPPEGPNGGFFDEKGEIPW